MEQSWQEIKEELKEIRKDVNTIQVGTAALGSEISSIKNSVHDIKNQLKNDFVTTESFSPIRALVYGAVSLIASGFILAVIALIGWRV